MLVGDSIMRNQWESLVCLVQGVIPTDKKRVTYNGSSTAFHAMVYRTFTNLILFFFPSKNDWLFMLFAYRILKHQLSSSGHHCWWNWIKELKIKEFYTWIWLKIMQGIGEELTFLCLIQLIGGHTQVKQARKKAFSFSSFPLECSIICFPP